MIKSTGAHAIGRRSVLLLVGSAGLALAQRSQPRIGFLGPSTFGVWPELREALETLGYVDGHSARFEVRLAENQLERLPALAAELVQARVDLIIGVSPPAILAASNATRSIPIVMGYWGGPGLIESGVVGSLARPGGNVTGVHMLGPELNPKRLELLIQAVPGAKRLAVLNSNAPPIPLAGLREVAAAAQVQIQLVDAPAAQGYAPVFEMLARDRVDAVLVPTSTRFYRDQRLIIEAAAKQRIPAMYEWGGMARAGGLIAYGAHMGKLSERLADYVHRILRGARPAEMPIEQPAHFELVVNLGAAKALGLTLPALILHRADEVVP